VDAGATVIEAVETLVKHRVGAVLIRNEDGLIDGIFSERDLLRRVVHQGLRGREVPEHAVCGDCLVQNLRR
jgi:CBS domain-containing protein